MLSENKGVIIKDQNIDINNSNNSTIFKNVEYKFLKKDKTPYILKGERAKIDPKNSNIIYLEKAHAYTNLKDGTVLDIYSNKAKFIKDQNNIFFSDSVKLINKNSKIFSDNCVFFYKKNQIEFSENVVLQDDQNLIRTDNLLYNLTSKNVLLKMNSKDKQVYGKRRN